MKKTETGYTMNIQAKNSISCSCLIVLLSIVFPALSRDENKIPDNKLFTIGNSKIGFTEMAMKVTLLEQLKLNTSLNKTQEDSTYLRKTNTQLIIKISPFHILAGDIITNSLSAGICFEKALNKTHSLHGGARYIFTDNRNVFDKRWIVIDVARINGFAVETELRKYFSAGKPEMSGAYLSANLKSIFTQAKYQSNTVNRFSTGLYINIGWQEIFNSGIVFDIAIGVGTKYAASSSKKDANLNRISYHIMDGGKKPYHKGSAFFMFPNLNFNLGYSF